MTTFQQSVIHTIMLGIAVVAAVVLAIMDKISGVEALSIVIAAAGISGTGVAGTVSVVAQGLSQPAKTSPVDSTRTPSTTT